jgi:SAM-dependent methyltransferase
MILDPKKIIPLLGVQHGMTVLDMGSSVGFWTKPIAHIVGPQGKVVAIDNHAEIIKRLHNDAQELNLSNIHALTGDINHVEYLPLRTESCDRILLVRMAGIIEHTSFEGMENLLGFLKSETGKLFIIDSLYYKNDIQSILVQHRNVLDFQEVIEVSERTNDNFFGLVVTKKSE